MFAIRAHSAHHPQTPMKGISMFKRIAESGRVDISPFTMRLSKEERAQMNALAASRDVKPSEWARSRALTTDAAPPVVPEKERAAAKKAAAEAAKPKTTHKVKSPKAKAAKSKPSPAKKPAGKAPSAAKAASGKKTKGVVAKKPAKAAKAKPQPKPKAKPQRINTNPIDDDGDAERDIQKAVDEANA